MILPASIDETSSDLATTKDSLEQHDLKQVDSPGTSYFCPCSLALCYFNRGTTFSALEFSCLSMVKWSFCNLVSQFKTSVLGPRDK